YAGPHAAQRTPYESPPSFEIPTGQPGCRKSPRKSEFQGMPASSCECADSPPGNRPPDTAADPAAAAPPAPFRWRSAAASAPGPDYRSTTHRRGARKRDGLRHRTYTPENREPEKQAHTPPPWRNWLPRDRLRPV